MFQPRRPATAILFTFTVCWVCCFPSHASDEFESQTVDSLILSADSSATCDGSTAYPSRSVEEIAVLQGAAIQLYRPQGSIPLFSVRGSEPEQTVYTLNGIRLNDPYTGLSLSRVSPHALQSIHFSPSSQAGSGTFGAASLVQMTTRSGTPKWTGMVESISDNVIGSGFDQNWYTTSLGGPIPGLKNGFVFGLLERRYFGDRNPSIKSDDILPNGSIRFPGNWLEGWSYNGRIDYRLSDKIDLTATVDGSNTEYSRYIHNYYFNWPHMPYYKEDFLSFSGRLDHRPSPTLDYYLQVSRSSTERFRGDGMIKEDLPAYVRPFANPELGRYGILWSWYYVDTFPFYGDEAHYWDDYLRHTSDRWSVSGELNKKFSDNVSLSLGGDWRRTGLRLFRNLVPTATFGIRYANILHVGYDQIGSEDDSGDSKWGNGERQCDALSLHLRPRLSFNELVVEPGLEWQLFRDDGLALKDPEKPFDPYGDGFADLTLDREDMEDTPNFSRLSASLHLGLRISERFAWSAGLRRSYSESPYEHKLASVQFISSRIAGGSFYPLPFPSLEPIEVTDFSTGVTFEDGNGSGASLTWFSRKENGYPRPFNQRATPISYTTISAMADVSNSGLEFSSVTLLSDMLTLRVNAAFLSSTSVGGSYEEAYNIAWKNPGDILTVSRPTEFDGLKLFRVTLTGTLDKGEGLAIGGHHPLENSKLVVIGQSRSGFKYTPVEPYNAIAYYSTTAIPSGPTNSESGPTVTTIDMMLERTFRMGEFDLAAFLWVENLLAKENIYYVYPGTGLPDQTGYLDTPEGQSRIEGDTPTPPAGMGFEERYLFAQANPLHYGNPRQVTFGLRVTF